MRPLRVGLLLPNLRAGGAERQMLELATRLPPADFRVDFLSVIGAGPLDSIAEAHGLKVQRLGDGSLSTSSLFRRVTGRTDKVRRYVSVVRRERYDIIDAWIYPVDVLAVLGRVLTRTPVVISGRRNMELHYHLGPVGAPVDGLMARMTDMVVANSEAVATFAVQEHRVRPAMLRVIRNGVEPIPPMAEEHRRAVRASLGIGDLDLLIGAVGHYREEKRHLLLLDAFARLAATRPHIRLVLIGEGPMRAQLESRITELGMGSRVRLHGFAIDARALYGAFDLVVQASRSEGLPNVLLEAGAAGRAIVATAAGGSVEVVKDGDTGLLVPVEDLDALASSMSRAVDDAELRQRLGLAARRHVEVAFGMDRYVREFGNLYRELAARKGVLA